MSDPRLEAATTHHCAGRLAEAAAIYRQLHKAHPDDPKLLRLLGFVIVQLGQPAVGIELIRRSIAINPNAGISHANLAYALRTMGRLELAVESYRRALALNPKMATMWSHLGDVLATLGDHISAATAVRRALELKPDSPSYLNQLGIELHEAGQLDEAVACFQRAIKLDPKFYRAHHNLALSLAQAGRVDQAIHRESQASELAPAAIRPASGRLFMLHFHPEFDREGIAREMKQFNELFGLPLATSIESHKNDRLPNRRLKIGYVSPDFFCQSEYFFLLPLLRSHDRTNFEIHCYSSVKRLDQVSGQFMQHADAWHNVMTETDEVLAQRIRNDSIDILVDLTMHMRDGRPLLFARKPAPVQVTWLAYPGGTGLTAIDFRLTDARLDPPDCDRYYAERSIRLPDCWCSYNPFSEESIDPQPHDFTRFASLNNPLKLNNRVLQLWTRVLQQSNDSRLLLLVNSDEHRRNIVQLFTQAGIDSQRLEFTAFLPRDEYLKRHNTIDVCLDPFPYNGITTTLDALWMGVPVVTLVGQTAPSRASLSILTAAGLEEFVAHSPDEFIAIAARAHEQPRAEIRRKVTQSPLFDYKRFAANVESAYREMWHRYVATA